VLPDGREMRHSHPLLERTGVKPMFDLSVQQIATDHLYD
jgi:hypothetical protein